ncbi:MAG: hypothetical protein EB051_00455 [Chlamydiia bacterium]|nr:hypothetical protein [Chlamydiia bacterium]
MMGILKNLQAKLSLFSIKEKWFLFAAMCSSYLISLDYALVRPVSNSLFLQAYGASALPYAWMLSIPMNFLIVVFYNKFIHKMGCLKMFLLIASVIAAGNTASSIWIGKGSFFPFIFYIWKDIYIMLMFQLLWSVIHSNVQIAKAKYLYGVLFGIGAIGGLSGSLLASKYAIQLGSESLLLGTLPIYLLLAWSYHKLIQYSSSLELGKDSDMQTGSSVKESLLLIGRSKLLKGIVLMVILMQVTSTITDFQFNTYLEQLYPSKDLRTAYFSKLLGWGNILTMSFQFIGVYVLIRYLGKLKTHLMVPLVLGCNCLAFLCYPVFGVISYSFLTIKCFDFSLFNVIKEMLYIPLKPQEKFKAKALIDVFMYRGAKMFASFFVMLVQLCVANSAVPLLSWITCILCIFWVFIILSIKQSYLEAQDSSLTPVSSDS